VFEEGQLYSPVTRAYDGEAVVHLDAGHPGATDPDYRRRRNSIATLAMDWRPGDPLPRVPYTDAEHAVWQTVCAELEPLHDDLACAGYLEGKQRLGLPTDHVPQLDQVTDALRPLTGFGLGTWSEVYPGYARFDDGLFANQAHNDWAQWAAEGGVPFLLLMLGVAGGAIRPAFRSLWGLGVFAVFLHCWVDYPMQQRPALAAFFFAMLGILAAYKHQTGSSPPSTYP